MTAASQPLRRFDLWHALLPTDETKNVVHAQHARFFFPFSLAPLLLISMGLWVLGFIKRIYIFTTHKRHTRTHLMTLTIVIAERSLFLIFFSSPTYCIRRCRCGLMMTTHALYYEPPSYDATRWIDSSSFLTRNFLVIPPSCCAWNSSFHGPIIIFPPICSIVEVPVTWSYHYLSRDDDVSIISRRI